MKAAVYYENGPPGVFKYEDVEDPACLPEGILIDVEAVSIEGGDTLNRARGELATVPHIVGYQAAGTIVEVGEKVTDQHVGVVEGQVVARLVAGQRAQLLQLHSDPREQHERPALRGPN